MDAISKNILNIIFRVKFIRHKKARYVLPLTETIVILFHFIINVIIISNGN